MAFAELLNAGGARAGSRRRRRHPVRRAGVQRLHGRGRRAGASRRCSAPIDGLKCKTAVHICYGYGIKANIDWKETLGGEWRQYEEIFPALATSRIDQVSLECRNSQGAARADVAAQGQGRAGRRDRRRDRRRSRRRRRSPRPSRRALQARAQGAHRRRAPIAAWRRCAATSRRPSSTRSARARRWRASGSARTWSRKVDSGFRNRSCSNQTAFRKPDDRSSACCRPCSASPRTPGRSPGALRAPAGTRSGTPWC